MLFIIIIIYSMPEEPNNLHYNFYEAISFQNKYNNQTRHLLSSLNDLPTRCILNRCF